jgi:hypothetical protein
MQATQGAPLLSKRNVALHPPGVEVMSCKLALAPPAVSPA